jgi:hypothetical protein
MRIFIPTGRRDEVNSKFSQRTLNAPNTQNCYFTFCWSCIVLWFFVNDQSDAQFFIMYLFLFLTLYIFRAHRAYHQERQIVSTQSLLTVTPCRWPCHVQVGSDFRPAPGTGPDTEWQLPEAVLTQFVYPDDEHDVLEICRVKIKINT